MAADGYPHIDFGDDGEPYIVGTRTKVVEVARERLEWDLHAEQIHRQHPDLTLGQIHGALAYYYDHREAVDRELEAMRRIEAEVAAGRRDSSLLSRLKALGLLP